MKNLLIPIAVICLLSGCKKDVDTVFPEERPFTREFYAQGAWRDTLPDTFDDFDYTVGKLVEVPYTNQYSCWSVQATDPKNKTIESGMFGFSNTNPLLFVRFSSPDVNAAWTASELNALFVPGRIFPITGKPGEVEIGFEIPWVINTYWVSQSGNALHPSGELKIISSEPYECFYQNSLRQLILQKGFKVKLQFHATLGRLVRKNGQLKVVGDAEIRDGEASLFFGY